MSSPTVEVDVTEVIREVEPRVIGINVDYLVDHDANRPAGARPLEAALREMGVRSLRFPGGDKSDNHLWSVPPFDKPQPTLACGPRQGREERLMDADGNRWNVRLLDFDDFMSLCRRLDAEPTVVVCYDALFTPGCTVTKERLLETAAAWVQYANVKRHYGVKYWEIGNEAYIDATVSPYDYARDLIEFAEAMKAVDPSIKIGANGPPRVEGPGRHEPTKDTPWWKIIFETAADHIDFIPVHVYSCWEWGSYEAYRDHGPGYPEAHRDALSPIEAARKWGPPGFADRLRLTVTETNAADWSENGWAKVNDLGHGLVVFDIFGTLLEIEQVDMAQLWNTRWVSHNPKEPSLWDAVDDNNRLQPTGQALAIWSQFLEDQMVRVSEVERLRTFASYSPASQRLTLFLINKDAAARDITVELKGYPGPPSAQQWLWHGRGPEDQQPVWFGPDTIAVGGDRINLALRPDSLTVLALGGGGGGFG
ncbi:MAG: alpha-L-arabinofuranosidase [Armatimonadota bacterium]|nr:MAG: alpha-L-arabinofuranosidase [Armatimonadota bacterium]